jgi:hypothetical protein
MGQINRLMGFGFVLCCMLLSASGVSAQVPAPTSLTGTWTITVNNRAMGPLTIKQDGNKITGTINLNEEGKALPVEGTVDGDKLHFTAKRSDGVVEDYTGTLQRSGEWMGQRNDSDNRIKGAKWVAGRAATSGATARPVEPANDFSG